MNQPISMLSFAICLACLIGFGSPIEASADVVASAPDGFSLQQAVATKLDPDLAFKKMVSEFGEWWDASHSYSGEGKNLRIDVEQGCILETLPNGGFVRHLELCYYDPGKAIRFSGGLGPLQEMGVSGALTFKFTKEDDSTKIELLYHVHGHSKQQLDQLAPVVDRVLADQLARLQKHCDGE